VQFALTVPTVRDRTVQAALRMVLEPIFERDFAAHSYGFRPNRGCKDALRRVQELLNAGYNIIVDASYCTLVYEAWLKRSGCDSSA
jgi:RNA-directed DNA polymerase